MNGGGPGSEMSRSKNKGKENDRNSRGSVLRVSQYSLNDVKFVEELGEGAFGNAEVVVPWYLCGLIIDPFQAKSTKES